MPLESTIRQSSGQRQMEPNSGAKTSSSSAINHRLWRPSAQRNMKNQWSRLNSFTQDWSTSSSSARSHATSLVNSFLSQRFMKDMEFGVLSDMPGIKKNACFKLLQQQVVHRENLLSSYKEMVRAVVNMVNTSTSLRCYFKGETNSPRIQFSSDINYDVNDNGDGGGIPVFLFWSISYFEKLACELVQMFKLELNLKRLLVIEFLSLSKEDSVIERLLWSDELYQGEFDDLSRCNMDCRDASESAPIKSDDFTSENINQPNSDVLQVYLTAWLTNVNIDKQRVEDIFCEVGEEMHVNFVS